METYAAKLETCTAELETCTAELETCTAELETCTAELETCTAELETCTAELETYISRRGHRSKRPGLRRAGPGTLGIVYRNGDKGRKGSKPYGVEGVRICYGFEPVTDQGQLPLSVWATRCPHTIRFPEADRGKRVYIALQWEIRKEHGESPWSEIQSELVP